MIRALITAVLLTGAANYFLHTPLDAALGYSVFVCIAVWYLWPALCRPARFLLHRLRPHRRPASRTPAARTPARPTAAQQQPLAPAHITQINHHHHYYNGAPPQPDRAPMRPDYTLPALPLRTESRIASDEILDAIIDVDIDDENPR